MNPIDVLIPLNSRLVEIHHLRDAASLLSWDQETYMPPGAGKARAEQIATLQTLAHQKLVSSDMEDILSPHIDPETGEIHVGSEFVWDGPSTALLRETWRDFSRAKKLPSDFVNRRERECALAQQIWTQARSKSDFSLFLPNLRTIVALKQEEAQYLRTKGSLYDALLDFYEPGATVETLQPLFVTLRDRLVALLARVRESRLKPEGSILYRSYDVQRQIDFGRKVLETMEYNFDHGRLDLSAHPFTTSFHPTDVRVTTRVYENELPVCLFSCIHEGGHGLYDQGLPVEHYGTPLGEPISLGMHESQSRLWENCVGRSRAFWRHFFPILQQYFPDQLAGVTLEQFYAAINAVKPSLIRVEADELTYNLHIMLRFEIELGLIEGAVQVQDLPTLWNEKMREYMGIVPERDADGVLQDVHWSLGAIGYFPTYTLGTLYASMFYEQVCRDVPHLEEQIALGKLRPLKEWLKQKIHRWGRQRTSDELLRQVTGQPLSLEPFLSHLETKIQDLYQCS